MIKGTTDVYGLIGNPVEQSFSPFIHNLFAEATGQDMVYTTFHVRDNQLENAIKGLEGLDIKGINVTVPYKMDVMAHLHRIDQVAESIGAVNTICWENGELVGYNTDWIGLKNALDDINVQLKGEDVLIIGAGGAARAVAVMCASEGVKKIAITNRTASKAQELCDLIASKYDVETEVVALEDLKDRADLTIAFQTTPIGMYPHVGNNPIYETKYYESLKVAIDLIYNPMETHFLREAREAGAITMNGMGMLFYQAVAAFELWRGITLDDETKQLGYQAFIDQMTLKNK